MGPNLNFLKNLVSISAYVKKGKSLNNEEELSNNFITELTKIQDKAEDLVKQTEQLLSK